MRKTVCVLAVGLWLAGCAFKNIPLNPATHGVVRGKSLVVIKRQSPDFVAMTSGKGMFAVAGVGAAVKSGNELVREMKIEDPALKTANSVAQLLKSRFGMSVRGVSREHAVSDDLQEILRLAAGRDYALDVATVGWSFIYDGFNFSDYMVGYSAKLRLIDVKAGEPVAQGLCIYDWKKADKPTVTYEQLLADNAAEIKRHLSESVEYCARFYTAELFRM